MKTNPALLAPIRRIAITILASAFVAALSTSCGTVRGIGHDVESVGEGIGRSAR